MTELELLNKVGSMSPERRKAFGRYVITYLLNKLPTEKHSMPSYKKIIEGEYCVIPTSSLPYVYMKRFPRSWRRRDFEKSVLNSLESKGIVKFHPDDNRWNSQYKRTLSGMIYGGTSQFAEQHMDSYLEELAKLLFNAAKEPFLARFNNLDELIKSAQTKSVRAKSRGNTRKAKNFTKVQQKRISEEVLNVVRRRLYRELEKIAPRHVNREYLRTIFAFGKRKYPYSDTPAGYLEGVYYGQVKVDLSGQKLYDAIQEETTIDIDNLLQTWISSKDSTLRRFAITFTESVAIGYVDNDPLVRQAAKLIDERQEQEKEQEAQKNNPRSLLDGLLR